MSDAEQETDQDASPQTAASLGDAAARPSIWELALPSILGNLSYTVVGMVQTKFVGELGPQALAAVGAGQRVMFAMLAVLMAVSAGTTWKIIPIAGWSCTPSPTRLSARVTLPMASSAIAAIAATY